MGKPGVNLSSQPGPQRSPSGGTHLHCIGEGRALGRVLICDLLVRGILGIHAHERATPQEIVINIELEADLRRAGESDDIADCVDYQRVVERVTAHTESVGRLTVEALAADIARLCLAESGVLSARVRVEKPSAIASCRAVGVEVEERRPSSG